MTLSITRMSASPQHHSVLVGLLGLVILPWTKARAIPISPCLILKLFKSFVESHYLNLGYVGAKLKPVPIRLSHVVNELGS